jgi:hypothetical protein
MGSRFHGRPNWLDLLLHASPAGTTNVQVDGKLVATLLKAEKRVTQQR